MIVGPLIIQRSLAIFIGSIVTALLIFFIISPFSKQETKKYINETITLLMTYIVFTWIGKVIMNLNRFVTDPLSVLAFPSDHQAFYLATLCTLIYSLIRYRNSMNAMKVAISFLYVCVIGSFLYHFTNILLQQQPHPVHIGEVVLYGFLFTVVLSFQPRLTYRNTLITFLLAVGLGNLFIHMIGKQSFLFLYVIDVWFWIAWLAGSIIILFQTKQVKKCQQQQI
ncbi:hypothetical protein [Pontibacillus litoralis]|uniref:Uncharacterized protein n=1 Tax=Pontibacillus litoralis JSM 072002 TaxID=1385512 RepID=A0A0A5G1L7_9BACI|nr:hypothetical protein [Pontibacillus litoralis]KGX84960.1 hypothetical protein N784_11335 [Pontibacillus litoralis JSM 072002]